MGMDDLRSLCILTGQAMPVYTLPRFQEDIKRVFNYAFMDFPPGVMVPRFELRDVPPIIEIGGLRVQTFLVEHGKIPCVGLRVNDFAYITDVSAIPPEAAELLHGLDTFVVDAVRREPHPNHFHLDRAIEVAKEIGARRTFFTHLSAEYDHDRVNATLPPGMELAYDGLSLNI
jgi:phosphoribosyl 1,2-cyclic phosphate phosphodiesterase